VSPSYTIVASVNAGNGCSNSSTTTYLGTTYYKLGQFNYGPSCGVDHALLGTSDAGGNITFTPAPPTYTDPIAAFTGPYVSGVVVASMPTGSSVSFQNASYDPDDQSTTPGTGICVYSWTLTREGSVYLTSSASNPSMTLSSPGHYTMQLTVKDNEGVSVSSSTVSFIVYGPREKGAKPTNVGGIRQKPGCPAQQAGGYGNSRAQTPGSIRVPVGGDPTYGVSADGGNGNSAVDAADPITTRGYPLTNNIRINAYRRYSGLSTSMGNAEFTYALRVVPYVGGGSHIALIDSGGGEYDFGPAAGPFAPEGGVYSTLTTTGGGTGYQLSGAGAPGHANEAGNYTYTFDGTGALQTITDPSSNVQQVQYSGLTPTGVDDLSSGRSITFGYTSGKITSVTEGGGAVVTKLSYTSNLLTGIESRDASNTLIRSLAITYNADGTPATVIRDGDSTTEIDIGYTDAGDGRTLADLSWPGSGGTRLNYFEIPGTGAVARTSQTNVQGQKTYFDYDSTGNLVRIVHPNLAGQSSATTETLGYNSGRRVTSYGDGITSLTMTYNTLGLLTGLSDNSSRSFTYSYSGADLTGISDAIGTLYSLTYGDSANPHSPTLLTDASSNAWTYAYNAYGQVLSVTPPSGSPTGATTYTYDETSSDAAFGWLASITNGAGDQTTFDSYSPLGDVLSLTTSPASGVHETVQYTYDALRRIRQIENPDTTTESFTFTGRDLTPIEDEATTVSDFTYCPTCGKLTGVNYSLSKGLVWNLNSDFEVTSFVDANNHSTSYTLGNAGELKYIIFPDSLEYKIEYRRPGEVKTYGLFSSPVTYRYDNAGRLTGVSYDGGSTYPISYTLRADDLPSAVTDEVGTRTLTYFTNRWLETASYNFSANGLSAAQEVDYTYNADGTVASVTWKSAGTTVASWSYSYDGAGRISSISNSFSETTGFTYDGEGKLLTQSNANGTSRAITYNDARGWPTLLEEKASGTDFASYALTYDSGSNTVGNLTGVTELDTSTLSYGYDALYRLTSETRAGTNSYSRTYGYDLANNLTTLNGSTFATYDSSNKFSSISGGTQSNDSKGDVAVASYTGFTTGVFTFDRRYKATTAGTNRINLYNAEGLRGATRASGSGQPNTFYIYDGDRVIGEINSSTGLLAAYTWGPGGIVSERILSGTPKSLWYHFGPQGETRQLTDSAATVVDTYRYTSYGVPLGTTGSDANPFRYGGKYGYYTDANIAGAILAGQRWYSPGIYRWMSKDPILYDGGDNPYAYVGGNPVRWVDPDGELKRQSAGHGGTGGPSSSSVNRKMQPIVHLPNGGEENMICGSGDEMELQECLAACSGGYEVMAQWCSSYGMTPQLSYLCQSAAIAGGAVCDGFCYARFVD
jgi:RHS repeat-associated protein